MLTEAQMRSSPACFSGSQSSVSSKRVIHRPQRTHLNLHLYTVSSSCRRSTKRPGTQGERTRQGPCTAARRDTREESIEMPTRQQHWELELSRSLSKSSLHTAVVIGVVAVLSALAVPAPADAAEALPLEFLSRFLDQVQQLGPWGPAAFILAVVCAEMIPLFPTQPLALSSGLLFGAQEGALCTILSTTLAASIAYTVAQGLGKSFAKQLIDKEVGEVLGKKDNAAQRALSKVNASAEKGSFWQQFSAVLALRMTPVIPFSATNYLLGLSSVPFKPFFAATFAAMAVWGPLYASIGAASRGVLKSRGDVGAVFSELQARTGEYSEKGAEVALVAGLVVLGLWATGVLKSDGSDDPDAGRLEQK